MSPESATPTPGELRATVAGAFRGVQLVARTDRAGNGTGEVLLHLPGHPPLRLIGMREVQPGSPGQTTFFGEPVVIPEEIFLLHLTIAIAYPLIGGSEIDPDAPPPLEFGHEHSR